MSEEQKPRAERRFSPKGCFKAAAFWTLIVLGLASYGFTWFTKRLDKALEREIQTLGRWPAPTAAAAEVIHADLSVLGLGKGDVRSARDDVAFKGEEWLYVDGYVSDYPTSATPAVSLWALRYDKVEAAEDDFLGLANFTQSACGRQFSRWREGRGFIICSYNDATRAVRWNHTWIVDVTVMEGGKTGEAKLRSVQQALASHWSALQATAAAPDQQPEAAR